jgi:hypothetical protein
MKRIGIVLIGMTLGMMVRAQDLDTAALKDFDAAVVEKVYALTRYTHLTSPQQLYLAHYFKLSDSLVRAWILQGKPTAKIDSLRDRADHIFYEINNIDPAKKAAFAQKNAERFAYLATQGEMEYLQKEYQPGPNEEKLIRQWVSTKYNFLYQRYLINDQEAGSARQAAQLYDLYQLYPALYSNRFINEYLQRLNAIKKIPDSIAIKIRNGFLNGIRADKYIDWSKTLLDITRYVLPDTALFSGMFHDQLIREAVTRSAVDKYNLIVTQHITNGAYDSVYGFILKKNYANCLIEFTYGTTKQYLVDSLIFEVSRHYDSAVKAALIRDGSLQPATQFALALKYKEYLQLSPAQCDSLVWQALYLSRVLDTMQLRDPFASTDFGDYEALHLTALLSEQQYTDLLMIRNKPGAYAQARRDWEDLVKFQIAQHFDKESTIIEIGNYYVARYSSWNRLAYDTKKQTDNMRALEDTKPQALKLLDQARWNPEPAKATNTMKLQW